MSDGRPVDPVRTTSASDGDGASGVGAGRVGDGGADRADDVGVVEATSPDPSVIDPVTATHPPVTRRRRHRLLRRPAFAIGDVEVAAGRSDIGQIPIARLVTGNQISLPVNVVHGRHEGPVVWLSAAVHGDEIGGVEIIRRTLADVDATSLAGTIVAVPIVNVHGFLNGDRYLPDRRDLNRSFPGSPTGSLAARLAHLFITEVVDRCDVGIDLHTGSDHRTNLPQIRADLDDPRTRDLAIAFGAPLMMHAKLRDGSMRAAATSTGSTVLLYEGGEAWRFDRFAIEAGVAGVGRVLARLGMTSPTDTPVGLDGALATPVPAESRSSGWVRVRRSGIALLDVELGQHVERGDVIATVRDSVGRRLSRTRASRSGMVIGHTQQPLVNQGDAIIHIAEIVGSPSDGPVESSERPVEPERAGIATSARSTRPPGAHPPDPTETEAHP
ncbi:succinylglutamate desuccinylase/aspartoacylase family protein [Ilumatobacter sp.]|uniref:succinylglutamate desuccinylase/aspartoacylase family protein n=1 Tax=Ilumatobacter sp. TaxID=1967498 RepID=UPI003B516E86